MDTAVTLISNVGFPIAMCLFLLWYINKKDADYISKLDTVEKELDTVRLDTTKALAEVNTALVNNTTVISRNTEVLDKITSKLE